MKVGSVIQCDFADQLTEVISQKPMREARILRIIVASPGDVQAERDLPPGVIDELNRGVAGD